MDALALFEVDEGVGLPGFVVEVLRYIQCALVPSGTESAASTEDVVGVDAGAAMGGVAGEGFHDEELIVTGQPRVGG